MTDERDGFPVLRRDVAGIDVGSEEHWVCAPSRTGDGRDVERFPATTPGLERLIAWLQDRRVRAVALERTGVYWIVPHEMLEQAEFEVRLVDTRELRRVPGRPKSDRRDCEWLQRLFSCGLLRGAFRPPETVCLLRTLVRDRATLIAERADWLRRMQKALDQMNVRVHRAVADLDGVTGMAIVRAIVGGERDPHRLAALRDYRCQKTEAAIAEQLTGHWRADHLFSLQQGLKMYDAITDRLADYEREILQQLAAMAQTDDTPPPPTNVNKARMIQKRGEEPLRQALYRISGVDLTTIDALGVETVNVILSEYGPDLSRFPTEKQFASPSRAPPGHQRWEARANPQKTAAPQRPRDHGVAHGRHIVAAQPVGARRVLSTDRSATRRRCRRVCHRTEARPMGLPRAAVGAAVRRRRGGGLRAPLPPSAHYTLGGHGERSRICPRLGGGLT